MKNIHLIILFVISIALVAVGALFKIVSKGVSGNEVILAALCLKFFIVIMLIWKNRTSIIPWLKQ